MNLNNLKPITFADKDPQKILEGFVKGYEKESNRTLAKADPLMTLFNVLTAQFVSLRATIDFTGKQNLLPYAQDEYLDAFAADFDLERKKAVKARVTMIFTLSQVLGYDLTIEAGTRVTADSKIFFEVPETVSVKAGQESATIICIATVGGDAGNNYVAGQIVNLVDPIAYIGGVVNIDASTGGDNKESDELFQARRLAAPDKLSTAGPDNAYKYWAREASTAVIDVEPYSPSPGVVQLVPLMTDGRLPTPAELALILETCNPEDRRPLTDKLEVIAPKQIDYRIELTYWISSKTDVEVSQIQAGVAQAVANFIYLTKTKLGRAINPSLLEAMIMAAGARRVVITAPTQTELTCLQVGNNTELVINYGGIEKDY